MRNSKLLNFSRWLGEFQSLYEQKRQLYKVDKVIMV